MGTFKKYKASFFVGLANSMEYRFDFFVDILSTAFPVILQVFLWIAMYENSVTGSMYGYTFPQMIMYVVVAGAVSKFTSTGIEEVVNEDIHSGGIAKYITKPVSYILFRLAGVLGQKFSSMITMILLTVASLSTLYFTFGYQIKPLSVLLFVPALILAAILNYYIFFCISMFAFWLTEIGSFFHAMKVVIMVLSGGVFPIEVFGSSFITISKFLPLSYTINVPIRILTGSAVLEEAFQVLVIQLFWILLLSVLSNILWNKGIKKYVAVGG
jgi:ABC-2 type transport system permease protein